jgi:penicillin-insensitive murein endopeptidase
MPFSKHVKSGTAALLLWCCPWPLLAIDGPPPLPLTRQEALELADRDNASGNILNQPAKILFGSRSEPAPLQARAIGSYARGCLAGAKALPVDGPTWQAMRLSRNRNWGHPELITLIENLAKEASEKDDWPGLLVGDLAQPRGGPMLTGHASHQIGLDADIWLTPMPDKRLSSQEREEMSAQSVLKEGTRTIDETIWTKAHARVIRRAALQENVARIFVHPAIKQKLCEWEKGDQTWLRVVRPWYGHHYHFHIRMACPEGSAGCKDQDPPPPGPGCGKALSWWLSDEPWKPKPGPKVTPKPMTMAALPQACQQIYLAQ